MSRCWGKVGGSPEPWHKMQEEEARGSEAPEKWRERFPFITEMAHLQ